MNLTERMVLESPFRIRNGKINLDHYSQIKSWKASAAFYKGRTKEGM